MFRGPSSTQNGACRPHRGRGIWPNPTRRTHEEDTQPNETIDKRRTTVPPAIRTISKTTASRYTKPQWRGRGRGNPYLSRGRGTGFGFAPASHSHGSSGRNESISSSYSHLTQRPSLNSASSAPSLSNHDLATQDRTIQVRRGDHALRNGTSSTFTTSPNLPVTPGLSEDRPTKRRRIEDQNAPYTGRSVSQLPAEHTYSFQGCIKHESLSPLPHPAVRRPDQPTPIKNEARSPSPPLARQLVTSGCIRYSPMPMNCRRLDPMYKFHRKEWARNEVAILKTKGLRTTRWFAREDGMVIEWSSRIPVWSDTLEPEVSPEPPPIPKISSAPQIRYGCANDTTALRKDLSFPPQTQSAVRKNECPSPSTVNPELPSPKEGAEVNDLLMLTEDRLASSFGATALVGSQTSAEDVLSEPTSSPEERGLEQMALAFLERFVQHFDDDRSSLLQGYHPDAFFSFRLHNLSDASASDSIPSILLSRNIFQGRERIGRALRLLESYKLCQEETSIVYDLLPQRDAVFISCHGEATDVDSPNPRPIYFGQSIILQRSEVGSHIDWPLVVVSHQITIGNFPADIFIAN